MSKSQERVAIFLPALYGGGAERTMLKLAGGIVERGYAVDLVLAQAKGEYLSEVPQKVRVVDLKVSRDLFSLPSLVGYLRRESPAILLSGLHTNIIAIMARRIASVPTRLIVSERNTFSVRTKSFSSDIRMRLMPNLVRLLYPFSDWVVAVSNGVARDLVETIGIPKEKVTVIYNPVITPELKAKALETLDYPWFKPGQPPVILSVGRLTAQKDFATLISAFVKVRETYDARLLILGEGDERQSLEAQVKRLGLDQYVSFPGFIANPYPYMRNATVFVLSSKFEGLPGSLIEALFCGPSLVATDCPSGPREILCDGDFGQLVSVGDPTSMAQAIIRALSKNVFVPTEESWKRFELEAIVDQYIELFFGTGDHEKRNDGMRIRENLQKG
jgi:glycosyltransferase involved in cell wall biosynthesis